MTWAALAPILLKLGASLIAILALAWFARRLGLGGDDRLRDPERARDLAEQAVCGFDAVDIALDRAGIAALLRDREGRQMLLRRHGAAWVGRLLAAHTQARLDREFLTIGTGERRFGETTLHLGPAAQVWAAGLRELPRA